MAFSFLEYIFSISEIFPFLYYENEESDDVIGGSTKTAQHSIDNNSRNIRAVFFKLGTRNVHHRRNVMTPSSCCHDNSYAMGSYDIITFIICIIPKREDSL